MRKFCFVMLFAILMCMPKVALAIPNLQVYIEGSTAGDFGSDRDTWLIGPSGEFNLHVVGSYSRDVVSITNVTLLATVLQGQTGTIDGLGLGTYHDTLSFLPHTDPKLNHYPLNKPKLYDFYTFSIGELVNNTKGLNNYDAGSGTITFDSRAKGQDKIFDVSVTGYDYIHFDAYAKFTNKCGGSYWVANPGSHDAADPEIPDVPEPATMILFGGAGLVGFVKRYFARV